MGKAVISLVVLALCAASATLAADDWWESGHFYQIYPRSYKDSDRDGLGDLKGITSKIPYLKSIGVTGVWLSPIFKSPMADFGYDISDFKDIYEKFGTMEDFEQLAQRCKDLGVKLILDLVPNHSSNEHEWFIKSSNPSDPEHEKYKDYYIWNEGTVLENGTRVPPTNWLSIFRGSAWKWVDSRGAYYYHQFLAEQPDLNYRNPDIVNEIKEVMRFWMRKGVSGFRCDAVPYLFEVEENSSGLFDDEPLSGQCSDDPEAACYLNKTNTQDLDETFDMIYQWRDVTEEDEFKDETRILMTEAYTSLENTLRFYGKVENGVITKYGAQIPFNFELISKTSMGSKSNDYKTNIENWINGMPNGKGIHANWVLGNRDNKRLASRYRPTRTDIFNILLKTLPGITVTYQGEEIGMTDVYISWEDTVDPQACRTNPNVFHQYSRDPARTPFQWDSTKNAGFSTGEKMWLPVADNYTDCNVELQEFQESSYLRIFRKLIELRQTPTFKYGSLKLDAVNDDVLVYKRGIEGQPDADIYAVALNLGYENNIIDLSASLGGLPEQMTVVVTSLHSSGPAVGDIVATNGLLVPAEVGIVLVGKNK